MLMGEQISLSKHVTLALNSIFTVRNQPEAK
jgi:hypothetical protein